MVFSLAAVPHALGVPHALVSDAPPAAGGGGNVGLRVASYNIHAGCAADGRFDLGRTIAAIRALGADVLGLQEVDVHWDGRSQWRDLAAELGRALGMSAHFGPIYEFDPPAEGRPRRRYGNAILSRYPIVDAENHAITRLSTQVPGASPEPAPGLPEVVIDACGVPVHVYSTHLDFRDDPEVRRMQVDDTLKILAADSQNGQPARQVLLGDFNAQPGAPELAPLWRTLIDAWDAAGHGRDGMTYPATTPDRRIDYVAVSRPVGVRAIHVAGTLASDHLPVVADLYVHHEA